MATTYQVLISVVEGGKNPIRLIETKSIREARKIYADAVERANECLEKVENPFHLNFSYDNCWRVELQRIVTVRGEITELEFIDYTKDVYYCKEPELIF